MSKRDLSTVLLANTNRIPPETIMPKGVEVLPWQEIMERLQPEECFVGCNPFDERGRSNNRMWVASRRGRLCPEFISAHGKIIDAVKKVRQLNREEISEQKRYDDMLSVCETQTLSGEGPVVDIAPATEETGL